MSTSENGSPQPLSDSDSVTMSGHEARVLEAEERPRAAAARLTIVHDDQHTVPAADALECLQPLEAGHVDAALALDGLDKHGGRMIGAAARVVQHAIQVVRGVHARAMVAVVGQEGRAHRRQTAVAVARAVSSVREGHHRIPARDVARELEGRLHRAGTCRPRRLHRVGQVALPQDEPFERLRERLCRVRRPVQPVRDGIGRRVVPQPPPERRMVVAVVERACAAEEIDVALAVRVHQRGAGRPGEHGRERTAIAAEIGFQLLEHVGHLPCPFP